MSRGVVTPGHRPVSAARCPTVDAYAVRWQRHGMPDAVTILNGEDFARLIKNRPIPVVDPEPPQDAA